MEKGYGGVKRGGVVDVEEKDGFWEECDRGDGGVDSGILEEYG